MKTAFNTELKILSLLLCLVLPKAFAQYEITKHAINNGRGTSKNIAEDVSITGSIGQLDASNIALTGGGFRVKGGFWTINWNKHE